MVNLLKIAGLLVEDAFQWLLLLFWSAEALRTENLFLRRQLALYIERGVQPHRVDAATRVSLALPARLFDWRGALVVVQPATMVRWHRAGWRCTRAALRLMEPRRSGKIINIASIAGLGAGSMHSPGYSATKAGVISLTKTTAYDVAGANIFVNAIACGGVMTPPLQAYLAGATEQQKNSLFQMIPLGCIGTPQEYASLAVYLASDEHYLVGQVISPNGGAVI
jgi:NAD(P)-dependent dehydrogenase (short-subunit alcohol dehydrogenase family)